MSLDGHRTRFLDTLLIVVYEGEMHNTTIYNGHNSYYYEGHLVIN